MIFAHNHQSGVAEPSRAGGAIPFTVDETTLFVILRVSAAATVALVLFAWGALLLEERVSQAAA